MIFCTQYEEAAPTHTLSEPSTSTIANKPKRDNTP